MNFEQIVLLTFALIALIAATFSFISSFNSMRKIKRQLKRMAELEARLQSAQSLPKEEQRRVAQEVWEELHRFPRR